MKLSSFFNIFPDMSFLFTEEKETFTPIELRPITHIKHMSVQEAWTQDFLNIGGDMRRAINKVMEHESISNQ